MKRPDTEETGTEKIIAVDVGGRTKIFPETNEQAYISSEISYPIDECE